MDEPARYAFFSLNDGKTPLFIWLLVPFQYLFTDQLFAGRIVAVLAGFLQVLLTGAVIRKLKGSRIAEMLGMLLVCFLPFWFFHHRMALMDGLLTAWITLALYYTISIQEYFTTTRTDQSLIASVIDTIKKIAWSKLTWLVVGCACAIGAAFWTKLPAVLAIPALYIWIFWQPSKKITGFFARLVPLGVATFGGLCIFALLKLHPAFGQLFSRGSDFLYPISDVLAGAWQHSLQQIPSYITYFISYLSPGLLLLLVFGLFVPSKHRRTIVLLTLSGLVFMAPIALMGKVVYARYFLPVGLFFTLAAILTIDVFIHYLQEKPVSKFAQQAAQKLQATIVLGTTGFLLLITIVTNLSASYFNSDATPFVPTDRVQYLTEWSSGHGITETVRLIQRESQTKRIAVATEGYFGTLPDALLLYLHSRPVNSIWLEGIGQPVRSIPPTFTRKAKTYDEVWLVANSHRMFLNLPKEQLKAEFCRPYQAPCLQVWDITQQLEQLPTE